MKRSIAVLALACTSCAVFDPQAGALRDADSAVADALNAARAPQSEQRTALARAQQAFKQSPDPLARLRLATMLALLAPPLRDQGHAAALLEPIADAGVPGTGRFAAFLAAELTEQQRLAHEADRLAKEGERMARERERVDRERDQREATLRQQVEALRSIERNIQERTEKLRRGQR